MGPGCNLQILKIFGTNVYKLTLSSFVYYNELMKKQTITPESIIEATILYVANNGLENVTTKKVALDMGISEGTIFNNFASKKALLEACLFYIDRQVDAVLKGISFKEIHITKIIRKMWFAYFYYFVEHWPYAKFYCQFRQSSYYDEEVMDGQGKSFSFFSKFLKQNAHRFGFCPDFYWVFIIETTLNFAVRVANGTLSGTPEDVERIYGLISHGFLGSLKLINPGEVK